jgi:hypothetical protein
LNPRNKQKLKNKTMENKIVSMKMSEDFKKEIIFNSLCNGLGQLQCYGLELYWDDSDYSKAKKSYYDRTQKISGACYEDILMEILTMGKQLSFIDEESEETHFFKLDSALKNLDNLPPQWILQLINEEDDGETADVVLQFCLFNKIVFG